MPNITYQGPTELGTKHTMQMGFLGCCGVTTVGFSGSTSPQIVEHDFNVLLDAKISRLCSYSVAEVVITDIQKVVLEPILVKFGFVPTWGGIRNINSGRLLFGYMLDLNKYRENTTVKLKEKTFETKT